MNVFFNFNQTKMSKVTKCILLVLGIIISGTFSLNAQNTISQFRERKTDLSDNHELKIVLRDYMKKAPDSQIIWLKVVQDIAEKTNYYEVTGVDTDNSFANSEFNRYTIYKDKFIVIDDQQSQQRFPYSQVFKKYTESFLKKRLIKTEKISNIVKSGDQIVQEETYYIYEPLVFTYTIINGRIINRETSLR